jgi:hypothetical protein
MTVPLIRAATTKDAEAISAIRLSGWRAAYGPLLPPGTLDGIDAAAWAQRLRGRLESGRADILVAETDRTAVRAFCYYGRCRDADLPDADEIYALYAEPAYWSGGRSLMAATLPQLRRPVALWVLQANARGRRFYQIAGFRTDGSVKDADLNGVALPEVRYFLP